MTSLPHRRRPPSFGCVVESSGTTIRAQLRSVAALVEVSGTLRVDRAEALHTQLRRFVLLKYPLILDLTCVVGANGELQRVLFPIEIDCSIGNVDFFVVVRHDQLNHVELPDGAEVVGSVGEALRTVVGRIRERRNPAFIARYAPELLPGA